MKLLVKVMTSGKTDRQESLYQGAQNIPVILPAFDTGGILFAPLFSELPQMFQGFVLCNRGINLLQIRHERLDVFVAGKTCGGADLVDDTALHLAVGVHCWLIPQAYNASIFSSIPSAFRLYLLMICGSYAPFLSRGTFTSTAPNCVLTVFLEYPFR